jgi:hypothetical protein
LTLTGELRAILEQALARVAPGARVLTIIPDKRRDDNTHLLFPFAEILAARNISQLYALVAPGTHLPMTAEEKRSKIDGNSVTGLGHIYDREWNAPDETRDDRRIEKSI